MKHNIKFDLQEGETNWVQVENSDKFCASAAGIESTDVKEIVETLLKEFNHTDESLIPLFREKLTTWLENADEKDLELTENEKLRDFIYEMF